MNRDLQFDNPAAFEYFLVSMNVAYAFASSTRDTCRDKSRTLGRTCSININTCLDHEWRVQECARRWKTRSIIVERKQTDVHTSLTILVSFLQLFKEFQDWDVSQVTRVSFVFLEMMWFICILVCKGIYRRVSHRFWWNLA